MDTFTALRSVPLFASMDDDEIRGVGAVMEK
jgi:hypothetical protein